MWSYDLDLRRIHLTIVKVVVSSEGTCNNCLFVEVFNYFLFWDSMALTSDLVFFLLMSQTLAVVSSFLSTRLILL